MTAYSGFFEAIGLQNWCSSNTEAGPLTMDQLLAQSQGPKKLEGPWWEVPFPSLDNLHESCGAIARTRDMTSGVERAFLDAKPYIKTILDPLTQPLSWMLDGALALFTNTPWWVLIPFLLIVVQLTTRKYAITFFVATSLLFLAFIDHYSFAIETLSIIFVCTVLNVILGIPIGIGMSRNNRFQKMMIPVLDMLQTMPSFVYLIPLIYLFSVTESRLYGIAIMLYAIVPVIRLTDLGIRLVNKDVLEAAHAFGMTSRQKLLGIQIPLAMPTIMAGVNQTIMMSLSMVVIASLVSAPGLGVLVLRGIRNLDLGVGLVSGFAIVILAIILDRVSKATLARIHSGQQQLDS